MNRPISNKIALIDEVEQALGLEILANIGAAHFASQVPQAGMILRACRPEAARVQPDG